MLYPSLIVSLSVYPQTELLVLKILRKFFELIHSIFPQGLYYILVLSSLEDLPPQLVISSRPQAAIEIANLYTHEEVGDCFFDELVAVVAVSFEFP